MDLSKLDFTTENPLWIETRPLTSQEGLEYHCDGVIGKLIYDFGEVYQIRIFIDNIIVHTFPMHYEIYDDSDGHGLFLSIEE